MNPSDIQKLAHLARLNINDDIAEETAKSITEVLSLVGQLQSANTDGVLPMAHPQDTTQRLRADSVSETDNRAAFQAIAPETEDGLYLVPKVID